MHIFCRLAYAIYILEMIRKSSGKLTYIVLYDIACMLQQHLKMTACEIFSHLVIQNVSKSILQIRGRQDILQRVTLGIPAFHVYGHGAKCQVLL